MSHKHYSPIWKMPRDEFLTLVNGCQTQREILRHFGLESVGGNATTLKKRLVAEGADISGLIARGKAFSHSKLKMGPEGRIIPLESILVTNSTYGRTHLKRRLIRDGLLKERCAICGLEPQWNGRPLIMILDHINGIRNDNRIENLRLICPNCNTQTDTFTSKNYAGQGRGWKEQNECPVCHQLKSSARKFCSRTCAKKFGGRLPPLLLGKRIVKWGKHWKADQCPVCGKDKIVYHKTCSPRCANVIKAGANWKELDLIQMRNQGKTIEDLCKELGLSRSTICARIRLQRLFGGDVAVASDSLKVVADVRTVPPEPARLIQ